MNIVCRDGIPKKDEIIQKLEVLRSLVHSYGISEVPISSDVQSSEIE
jgi:hypothetical protein